MWVSSLMVSSSLVQERLERPRAKGTMAAAKATVYITAQFTWAAWGWAPKEEELTMWCQPGLFKDAHSV